MTDFSELARAVSEFAKEREWEPFHSPKNLAMALAVEVAELLEHFQWLREQESFELGEERLQAVAYEIADVQIYLMRLAERLGVDILAATAAKLEINRARYPVEKCRGSAQKHTAHADSGSNDA